MENTCVYSSGNAGGSYIYALEYNRYIESKIKNEESLIKQLGQYIPVNEAAYKNIRVVTEAKATDRIKNKMQKVGQFIKNLLGKFMESITHILLNEKEYLKKYEDIIKKKRPKTGMKYSYTGDYTKAINRCINTTVPVFNYQTHAAALKQDGYGPIVKIIMQHQEFTYDESDSVTLASQFKEFFLASENDKESSGEFSDLNFTTMYDFCYNFKKIEDITKKDQNYITQSTTAIVNAANQRIKDNAAVQTGTGNAAEKTESFRFASGDYFMELEITDDTKKEDNNTSTSKNTNAVSQMGSTDNNNSKTISDDDAKTNSIGSDQETEDEMYKMGDKYTTVCNTLIAAKCTAVQQIAKDYMDIIRAHVRSYVGNDKDKTDDRTAKAGATYSKNNNNNQQEKKDNKKLSQEEIIKRRKDLAHRIEKMEDGPEKEELRNELRELQNMDK